MIDAKKKLTHIAVNEDVKLQLEALKRKLRKKNMSEVLKFLIASYDAYQQNQNQNEVKENQNNPYEFAQKNPCPYRTLIKSRDGFYVLCAETKKIPLEACVTRQKRYLAFEKKCFPISLSKKPKAKPQKPMRTKIYRDEFERDYYPDNDSYYSDTWGDYF